MSPTIQKPNIKYPERHSQVPTVHGAITTLITSIVLFILIQACFEFNRYYKQIYLKRLQKRFEDIGRVPPVPPNHVFGWLIAIMNVSETDVLRMVGLDAYMLLRYQTVCFKLAVFMSFWGLLILVPLYSTASYETQWDKYTLSNVINSDTTTKYRLWFAAIFGYVFSAYFCQLLYAEYSNFSVRRLQYLVQADPDNPQGDPDTPAQKYFTVMVERIPGHLRSQAALQKFFENLFPGELYHCEIALDLRHLDSLNAERKSVRDSLEKAIAEWEATNVRPKVYIQTGKVTEFPDDTEGLAGESHSWKAWFQKKLAPEKFGFENLDALKYYTDRLIELNKKMVELQMNTTEYAVKADKDLERKLIKKHDTRAAHIIESMGAVGAGVTDFFKKVNSDGGGGIESLFFGPIVQDYKTVADTEMLKVEVLNKKSLDDSGHSGARSRRADSLGSHAHNDTDIGANSEHSRHAQPQAQAQAQRPSIAPRSSFAVPSPSGPAGGGGAGTTVSAGLDWSNHSAYSTGSASAGRSGGYGYGAARSTSGGRETRERSGVGHSPEGDEEERKDGDLDRVGASLERAFENDPTISKWLKRNKIDLAAESGKYNPGADQSDADSRAPSRRPSVADMNEAGFGSGDFAGSSGTVSHRPSFVDAYSQQQARAALGPGQASPRPSFATGCQSGGASARPSLAPLPPAAFAEGYEADKTAAEHSNGETLNPILAGTAQRRNSNKVFHDAQEDPAGSIPKSSSRFFGTVPSASRFMTSEQMEEAERLKNLASSHASLAAREALAATNNAASALFRGAIEMERAGELLFLGAFYKYSSTAFVTFETRVTESIAHQMLLSHDSMEISHAPNPHDIIWENVAIPKNQITMRKFVTDVGLLVGSLFWSSLVTAVNDFSAYLRLPPSQQQYLSVLIMLGFLMILPFIFDVIARYYEGMKLESEIQNSINSRYFYYQLINIYVTVGFSTDDIIMQLFKILARPKLLVDILGKNVPAVSLYFCSLVIVKLFAAVPMEMIRPWQLSTILTMGHCMDRRKCTRRDLRTGAFFAWPMLYGWVYPQLMMVLMIQVTYACIAPLLMPLCAVFFAFAYTMYKYQLLYVYINDYQSGGFMWYAVFARSMVALLFAAFTLLGYLSLELKQTYFAGPFFFLLPLPFFVVYFWIYCESKFKKQSMNLSLHFAKELDIRNRERKEAGRPTPHDQFSPICYRQPSLKEGGVHPEPYRNDGTYDYLKIMAADAEMGAAGSSYKERRDRRGSVSLNVHEALDNGEEDTRVLQAYFDEVVLPLANSDPAVLPESADDGTDSNQLLEIATRSRSRR